MISNLLMAAGKQAPISTVDMVDPFGDGSGIALYKFDGDATDESGAYNGTAYSMTYTEGQFGQAMEGGSNKYVTVPIGGYPISISQWVYLPSLSHAAKGAWSRCIQNTYGVGLQVYPNQLYITCWSAANGNTEYTVVTKPVIGWNHFYTYMDVNGDGFIIVNNVKETFNLGTPYASLPASIDIGRRNFYLTYNDTGTLVDQVRFFNRALTQAEVTALYNEGQ